MSRYIGFHTQTKRYLNEMKYKEVGAEHLKRTEQNLERIFRILKDNGRNTEPERIKYDDILFIRDSIPISTKLNRSAQNQISLVDCFRSFLNFCGNPIRRPPFKQFIPDRPKLSSQQVDSILMQLENEEDWDLITGRIMVFLGSLGLRRVGQLRLKIQDIEPTLMRVLGKGRNGGKPRTVPLDPWSYSILKQYIDKRNSIIIDCLRKKPGQNIISNLLISHSPKTNKFKNLSKSKFDKIMNQVSTITGIKVTAHRLRRYFGTDHFKVCGNTEHSMKLGGWNDARTFRLYCQIDQEDLDSSMKNFYQHRYDRMYRKQQLEQSQSPIQAQPEIETPIMVENE